MYYKPSLRALYEKKLNMDHAQFKELRKKETEKQDQIKAVRIPLVLSPSFFPASYVLDH